MQFPDFINSASSISSHPTIVGGYNQSTSLISTLRSGPATWICLDSHYFRTATDNDAWRNQWTEPVTEA